MTSLENLRSLLDEALNGDPKAESEFLGRYGERLLDVAEAAREQQEAYRTGYGDDPLWDTVVAALAYFDEEVTDE